MTPERWRRIREVLGDALELGPEDRPSFLDRACSSDPELRREVESLLVNGDEPRSGGLRSSAFRPGLATGTRLGDYTVEEMLGSGGMGEVYRAHDTRLGRDVAVKVLPSFLARDPDRLRRFEQEARAAAALNHPNIVAVFQFGMYEGAPYLVSELLQGATLREHLARGAMPLRRAIDCAIQVAHGLAAAHDKGIVHRDLKPENLFVLKDGRAKILDFGLAKLAARDRASRANTTKSAGTEAGVVMGTVGYMSPEQVSGEPADHRADIFAFGAILYEMLSGKRAFQKPTSAETMSAILNEEVPTGSLAIPSQLQRVVHRCLEKDREQRFQSASDLAFALEALSDAGTTTATALQTHSRRAFEWAVAILVLLPFVLGGFAWWLNRRPETVPVPSFTRLTWDSALTMDPALSPDGKLVAYASDRSDEGHLDIYVQQVAGGEPLRLTRGPGDKRGPTFSPDGTAIAFQSAGDGGIYVISALGGTPRKIAAEGSCPQFSPDGKWVAYSVGEMGAVSLNVPGAARMYVVAANGGIPRQVRPDFAGAIYPVWSPDGGHLLFLGNPDATTEDTVDWWVTPLSTGPAIRTGAFEATRRASIGGDLQAYPWALTTPCWEPGTNGLFFSARSGDRFNVWRIAISPTTFKVTGDPQRVTSGLAREGHPSVVSTTGGTIRMAFSSTIDDIAVWSLPVKGNDGTVVGEPRQLTHDPGGDFMPYVSHDGARIVYVSTRPGNQEIWSKNLRSGEASPLTASRVTKYAPTFSPDGSRVSFSESPAWDVYIVPSNGGAQEVVCRGCGEATDWSSDGARLLGNTLDGRGWLLDVATRRKTDLLATRRWIATDSFSPDNRWFSFVAVGRGLHRAYIAPMGESPVRESAWIPIMDGEIDAWSPDGDLAYAYSYRDGHLCIWAQRLDPATKQPRGAPFAVFHAHDARLSFSNQTETTLSIGNDVLVFSMGQRTGDVWMAEWTPH